MAHPKLANEDKLFDMSHAISVLCLVALAFVLAVGKISPWVAPIAIIFLGVSVMMSVHQNQQLSAVYRVHE